MKIKELYRPNQVLEIANLGMLQLNLNEENKVSKIFINIKINNNCSNYNIRINKKNMLRQCNKIVMRNYNNLRK